MSNRVRRVLTHVPAVAAMAGMTIVFAGLTFFSPVSSSARIGSIAAGLLVFLGGMWFAANPYLRDERRYVQLRAEVDGFIELVKRLNGAVLAEGRGNKFNSIKGAMYESIEKMGELAGKEGKPNIRLAPVGSLDPSEHLESTVEHAR